MFCYVFETLRILPRGTYDTQQFLIRGADGLVAGGVSETFTPMFFFLCRKVRNQRFVFFFLMHLFGSPKMQERPLLRPEADRVLVLEERKRPHRQENKDSQQSFFFHRNFLCCFVGVIFPV